MKNYMEAVKKEGGVVAKLGGSSNALLLYRLHIVLHPLSPPISAPPRLGMKPLPGTTGRAKAFLAEFASGHVGMVQRVIGSSSRP